MTAPLKSYLSNHLISVVDGATFDLLPVFSGVLLGSDLSTTLFLLFINDLLSSTTSLIHAFADDSTLHISSYFNSFTSSAVHSDSQATMALTINSGLESISGWDSQNLVEFNASRKQFLPVFLSTNPLIPKFYLRVISFKVHAWDRSIDP